MPRFRSAVHTDIPASPPPEVLHEIDLAWERSRELFESDMELHFEVDALVGRVWAELRLPDGSVAERLSAREALAIACGDPVAAPALAA